MNEVDLLRDPAYRVPTPPNCDHHWQIESQHSYGPAPGFETLPFSRTINWFCVRCRQIESTTTTEDREGIKQRLVQPGVEACRPTPTQ